MEEVIETNILFIKNIKGFQIYAKMADFIAFGLWISECEIKVAFMWLVAGVE